MADLIDRQAAIDETWKEPTYTDPLNVLTEVRDRINALPSAQPDVPDTNVGDMISRQAAIDTTDEVTWYHQNKNGEMVAGASTEHEAWYKADDIYKALKAVPSAERHGEWIQKSTGGESFYTCSRCGFIAWEHEDTNYCPNCGARMDG